MEVHALDDVTMTVKDGDFVTITGPSGSGKSTLMRVVEGMECADQGNCILNGIDLAKSSDKKRAEIRNQKMGIVLQDFGLFNDQTVKQNLQLPFLIAKRSIKSANIRAQEILEYLHIAELTNRKVQTLSGGQKQRVAIARGLMMDANLILADEPTGSVALVQHYPKTTPVIFWSLSILISLMTERQSVRFSSRVKVS